MFNLFTAEVYYIIAGALLVLDIVLTLRVVQIFIANYRQRKANKAETEVETEVETLSKDEMATNIIRRYGYEDNATIVFCEVCDLCTAEACAEIYNDLLAAYGETNA